MLSDVNLRYLYALHQIPQHVFEKFMLARHFVPATSPLFFVTEGAVAAIPLNVPLQAMR